ncbi:MAG TPA: discoidin domain-containing protein, partial [Polyangiaceae bacterium]|nr:discoidin domain-containing protein [Polyangiaceae bacterium]
MPRPADPKRTACLVALCCSLLLLLLAGTAWAAPSDLLSGRKPVKSQGVRDARGLTDGVRAEEGDDWGSDAAVKLDSSRSFVEYDLGKVTPITAAYLQGDNNDEYTISASDDGQSFKRLWVASPLDDKGLRQRYSNKLSGSARYIRLTASGGDGAYAVSELQLFEKAPATFPPKARVQGGSARAAIVRDRLLAFVFAVALFLFATSKKKASGLIVAALPALVTGFMLVRAMADAWPIAARELSMLRAAMAGLAGLALLREAFLRKKFPAHPAALVATLVVSATVAFASFYNLGVPQFWNEKEDRAEFVHTWDMRIYYPFAKYFDELGYDGVYLASAGAYLDDVPGATLAKIGQHEIRYLDTLRVRKLADSGPDIERVKERFSPERWQSFKQDMTYFREVMGRDYLRTLNDHGANATPVWILCASLIFNWAPASEAVLVFGGLVDAFLLLGLFFVIWRSFGLRAMLLSMVVFGANDFYMFGTNWGGATLRHDWLAYLGFGVCALATRRFALAGVLFGLSTMIRAFPLLALAGVVLPMAWWALEKRRQDGKLPGLAALRAEQGPALRVLAGALAAMVGLFLITGIVFSFGAWT